MKRSKASKGIAEKALEKAIADGTAHVQGELRKALARVAFLEGLLARVGVIAKSGQPDAVMPVLAQAEPVEPEVAAPAAELAGEDNMGDGRWA